MKRILAAVTVMALLVSLSACSFDLFGLSKKSIGDLPAEEAMAQVSEKIKEVKSLKMNGTMDIAMSAMGIDINMQTEYKTEQIKDPYQFHMNMSMDMGGFGGGKQELEMYSFGDGDQYTVYTKMGDRWTKTSSELPGAGTISDAVKYIDDVVSYEMIGKEIINEKSTVHYSGKIAKDKIGEILNSSGMLNAFEGIGIDFGALMQEENLGDVIFEIWVSEREALPVRMSINMTDLMNHLFEKISGGVGVKVNIEDVGMNFELYDYNVISEIALPEEVRKVQ